MTKIISSQDFEKYADQRPMNGLIAEDFIKVMLPHLKNLSKDALVLDFGCGDGRYFPFFKKFFLEKNIYGVEVSSKRIENCKKIGWKKTFLIEEKNKLPFANDFFDFINFDQVIEHILEENIDFYLDEICRVLKPSGMLVAVTPNYPIKRLYDLVIGIKTLSWQKIKDDPTHVSFYNTQKLFEIFKKRFNDVEIVSAGGFFYRLFSTPFFSHKLIALCTKKR